jgi:hypothetical protein
MSIQAKQCRQNALLCGHFAETTLRPTQAQIFSNLANRWVRLAVQLEREQALRNESEPKSGRAPLPARLNDNKQSSPSNPPNAYGSGSWRMAGSISKNGTLPPLRSPILLLRTKCLP